MSTDNMAMGLERLRRMNRSDLESEIERLRAEVKASAKQCMEIAGERDELRRRADEAEAENRRLRGELSAITRERDDLFERVTR